MPPKGKRGSKAAAEAIDDSGEMRVNLFDIDSGEADAYSFTETDDDPRGGDTSKRSASGKTGGDQSYSRKLNSLSLNLQTKRALVERSSDTRTTKPARQRFQLAPTSFNVSPPSASTFNTSRKRRALFDDDEEDTDWRVASSGSNGASHNYSRNSGSRNASFLRGGGMPRRFRKGAFLVNELDVERARTDYTRVPLWRVEDAVSSLVRRYEPFPTDSMLYHRSTDSYRLTTGQEHNYHLVQSIVFVKKDDNVLLYHVRDWPKLTGPFDNDDNGEGEAEEEGDDVDDGDGDDDGDVDDNGETVMELPNAVDSRDTQPAGTTADVYSRKEDANVVLSNASANLTNNEDVATASESPALN